jgi:hypothetical protein
LYVILRGLVQPSCSAVVREAALLN